MRPDERFVSITGVRPHGHVNRWMFRWHSHRALARARQAPGNLFAELHRQDGMIFALTIWDNAPALYRFARSKARAKALLMFRANASGKSFGFLSESVPSWPDAISLCEAKGSFFGTLPPEPPQAPPKGPPATATEATEAERTKTRATEPQD
ncbi:MAG: hypothetical protein AAFR93_01635 [Pseudomonadota bacterium]